jgi:anti-anti-sigma factor
LLRTPVAQGENPLQGSLGMIATVYLNDVASPPGVDVSLPGTRIDATCTIVALRGELDAAALNSLVESFDDAIDADRSDIVVDLAAVEFIGAAWIGTLVRGRARLEAQDRELTLRSVPLVLYRLLELCGLAYLIEPSLI